MFTFKVTPLLLIILIIIFRIKQSILQRGNVVASRWRRAALKTKLQNAAQYAAAQSKGKDHPDGRPKSKVTMVDIARLVVADRDSRAPSDDENDENEENCKTAL